MVPVNYWTKAHLHLFSIPKLEMTQKEIFAMSAKASVELMAADYSKPDRAVIATTTCGHLTQSQRDQLLTVLQWCKQVFLGKKGTHMGGPCDIVLKKLRSPSGVHPTPAVQYQSLTTALSGVSGLPPPFGMPKKNRSIRLVIDFCKLNTQLKQKMYPLPT